MTLRCGLKMLLCVVFFGAISSVGQSRRPEVTITPRSDVTCRFDVESVESDGIFVVYGASGLGEVYRGREKPKGGHFEIRGTQQNPQYVVTFHFDSGIACLEQHGDLWPETFDMKIRCSADTILFISLFVDGYGEMMLWFLPGKNWVSHYDERGQELAQPTATSIRVEAIQTREGVDAKVTLPPT